MRGTRTLHGIHQWTGLIAGINMLILSITGAYLVFAHDLEHFFEHERGEVILTIPPGSTPTPIQATADALQTRHPGALFLGVRPLEPGEPILALRYVEGEDTIHQYEFDPATGEVTRAIETVAAQINHFILHLHADLFLGFLGSVFVGFIAVLFLISTVSGIIIYAPFMKQAVFGALRFDRGVRRASADLHKLVGSSALVFNLVIALTGVALTFGFLGARMWAANEVKLRTSASTVPALAEGQPLPPIDQVMATAMKVHPDAPISSITMPGSFQGPGHYFLFHQLPGPLQKFVPVYSLVAVGNPSVGEAVEVPLWIDLLMISVPLHFGNYGGFLLKLVYCVLSIGSGLLSITGFVLTFSRWRKKWRHRRNRKVATEAATPQPVDA